MPVPPPPAAPRPPALAPARRRWPWVAGAATLVLVVGLATFVVVRRDPEPARSAAILDRLDQLLAGEPAPADSDESGDGGRQPGPGGDGDAPVAPPTTDGGQLPDQLEDLLGGMGGVDPSCLAAAASTPKLTGSVEGDVAEQVATIVRLVEAERGLRFERPIEPELLAADEFDRRIEEMVQAEYPVEQADLDGRVLELLGAVPRGTDLKALQADLLSGQVAGYYDPDSGEVVVRVADGQTSLDAASQVTLAHELDHALTDQALGLPDTDGPGQADEALAGLALVEGDATLLMQRFAAGHVGLLDQLQGALGPDALAAQEDLAAVPPYLRNELMFPYTAGLSYACRLQQQGGWAAVDAAYEKVPRSTAEILFPERAGLTPTDLADPADPGGSWLHARSDTLGAAPLQWLLEAPGGDEADALASAEEVAGTWTGGELTLYTDGPRSALAVALSGDDGEALCTAVERWYSAAFDTTRSGAGARAVLTGGDQVGVLRCLDGEVRLGIAPDEATAARLAA